MKAHEPIGINKAAYASLEEVKTWSDDEIKHAAYLVREQATYERTQGDDSGVCSMVRSLRSRAVQLDTVLKERRAARRVR